MFYLGFSNCASAELCALVCFSLMFYYFHAKKNCIYKFLGGSPLDEDADFWDEIPEYDKNIISETFFSEYGDIMEYSSFYEQWFYEPDAIEQIVDHIENTMSYDDASKQLQKFMKAEVTESWFMVYSKYYDPKYTWYS